MRYNRRARLDRSQVEDRRGRRSGGGSGMSGLPGLGRGGGGMSGIPVGGGIGGILLFIIIAVVAAKMGGIPGTGGDSSSSGSTSSLDECRTGADTTQQQCRILDDVNAIQSFWSQDLPKQAGVDYTHANIVYFTSSTDTACGPATVQSGPFYCPGDGKVYLELGFFDDMLKGQLGASGGDFSDAYVVAHEYGHHVQDLLGTLRKNQSSQTGPKSPSVRIELQADCYAGIWAHNATTAKDADGNTYIEDLTPNDIKQAINAATAVGDDHIQQLGGGNVNPEQWTHGSSAERIHWFMTGYQQGTLTACDTFSTDHP